MHKDFDLFSNLNVYGFSKIRYLTDTDNFLLWMTYRIGLIRKKSLQRF